jgi:hypothetical protein
LGLEETDKTLLGEGKDVESDVAFKLDSNSAVEFNQKFSLLFHVSYSECQRIRREVTSILGGVCGVKGGQFWDLGLRVVLIPPPR